MSRFCNCGIFRSIFERVVGACIGAGLVGGEGFAVDASLIVADANKQRSIRGAQWSTTIDPQTASRATKEYLAILDDAAFGAASEVRPKYVSPSDPAAQWTGAMWLAIYRWTSGTSPKSSFERAATEIGRVVAP